MLFSLFYLPVFVLKGKYKDGLAQRLGNLPPTRYLPSVASAKEGTLSAKTIWLHAVSVGEVMASSAIIRSLKERFPNGKFIISTTTQTGQTVAKSIASPQDLVIYFPLDISFIVKRAVDRLNPDLLILTETEIWPNLISCLHKKGIPVILVNGRISPSSFMGYKLIKPIFKQVLKKITLFCMRSETDAKKIIELGAEPGKVCVAGNVKFDVAPSPHRGEGCLPKAGEGEGESKRRDILGIEDEDVLIVAGSTHNPEEKMLLNVYKRLLSKNANLKLLIAPRHIERVQEIEKLIIKEGLVPARLSGEKGSRPEILILDTIGQLKNFYLFADIVFVGGSLIKHGGQNIIEPASLAKPVVYGPHMFNFQDISDLFIENKAAVMVQDEAGLEQELAGLIADVEQRQELGRQARLVVEQNRGAVSKTIELLRPFLE